MARTIDHVLALLPFEPPLMQAAGMSCDFVGHPVVSERRATAAEAAAFRARIGVAPDAPLLLMLPGSRMGEITRLGPRFGATLAMLRGRHPALAAVVPTVPHVEAAVRQMAAGWGAHVVVAPDDKLAAFAAADLALAASGTVSLELAANGVPMVIGYDMAPLTRWLLGRMLQTDTVTLVNLVAESRTVPEFLGQNCRPELMAGALEALLDEPAARIRQIEAMELTMQRLGQGGEAPGLRAARSVLDYLVRRRTIQPPPSTRVPSAS